MRITRARSEESAPSRRKPHQATNRHNKEVTGPASIIGNAGLRMLLRSPGPQRPDGTRAAHLDESVARAIQQRRGSGAPLPGGLRGQMEAAFGEDFSRVRIHTDADSHQLNESVQARAFTVGKDIFFADRVYSAGSDDGKKLIAHELAHVVQQAVPSAGPPTGISNPRQAPEREAHVIAEHVMAEGGRGERQTGAQVMTEPAGTLVQRSGSPGRPPPPGMIGNDPRIGALWERAVVETLGRRFQAQTYGQTVAAFQKEVAARIAAHGGDLGSNRASGTGINYARRGYASVRTAFGRLAAQSGISLEGLQVHHTFDELAQAPHEALTTTNLTFARGNAGTLGSGHNFAHRVSEAHAQGARNPGQQVVRELDAIGVTPDVPELSPSIREASIRPTAPVASTSTAPAIRGSRSARVTAGARRAPQALLQSAQRATPTITRGLGVAAQGGARVVGVAGRAAAPLAIAESGYRLATATNNLDRLQAGADTAAGAAGYAGPVGLAFSTGYGAGQLLDYAAEGLTGESLSSRQAGGMVAADRAVSSLLPEDESLPEYKRENRIAWWLIDTFDL